MARLLVVDDDPEILECLAVLLSDRYQVLTVKSGVEALKELQTQPFDAMVIDLVMPLMDGETLIERMQALGIAVPFVLASASLEVGAIAARLGVDYLRKPYDSVLLETKLQKLLQPNVFGAI